MNCCKPQQVGTKEHGKMLKRIQILEDGRVPAKEAPKWKIEGKMTINRKDYRRLLSEFEMDGFMAGLWNLERENMLLVEKTRKKEKWRLTGKLKKWAAKRG